MTGKERPIIFNSEMVRAVLDNRKTQTRRTIKPLPPTSNAHSAKTYFDKDTKKWYWQLWKNKTVCDPIIGKCPYGKVGGRLWVKEVFCEPCAAKGSHGCGSAPCYKADMQETPSICEGIVKWQSSAHMPRWASRITLEITGIRVERVQEITGQEAWLEGFRPSESPMMETVECELEECRNKFKGCWNTIYGPDAWEENWWCWVVEFRRVSP